MRTVTLWLLALIPGICFGWGGTGHRIICEIAYLELKADVRQEVDRLITILPEYNEFRDSCNEPDRPRQRAPEHFVNLERSTSSISQSTNCPLATTCLYTAIRSDIAVLKSDTDTDAQKAKALAFLGHWVGDIHQPLHVSFRDDRGGNLVREQGGPCSRNLHAVWDTCIIHRQILSESNVGNRVEQVAADLLAYTTAQQRDQWHRNRMSTWANESYQISIAPETGYCDLQGGSCIYDAASNRTVFTEGEDQKRVTISRDYISAKVPTIQGRLVRAGVRLGGILNDALADESTTTLEQRVMELESLVEDLQRHKH